MGVLDSWSLVLVDILLYPESSIRCKENSRQKLANKMATSRCRGSMQRECSQSLTRSEDVLIGDRRSIVVYFSCGQLLGIANQDSFFGDPSLFVFPVVNRLGSPTKAVFFRFPCFITKWSNHPRSSTPRHLYMHRFKLGRCCV